MRTYKLQVMLSPEEREMVEKLAESMAISNSAAVRYLIRSAASSAWGGTTTPPHVVIGHWSDQGENDEIRAAKRPDRK